MIVKYLLMSYVIKQNCGVEMHARKVAAKQTATNPKHASLTATTTPFHRFRCNCIVIQTMAQPAFQEDPVGHQQ